jgi:hypothetical protein
MSYASDFQNFHSPSFVISTSPKTPLTSNTTQVRFYLPPPYSSTSSSQSTDTTPPFTQLSGDNPCRTPAKYSPITELTQHSYYSFTPIVSQETVLQKPKVPSRYQIMPDDEEYSSSDEASSKFPDDTDNETSSVATIPNVEEINPTNISVVDLAASLLDDKNGTFNLSKKEEDLIQGSTVNTKRYEKTKWGVEDRFFETIQNHGGPQLNQLLPIITTKKGTERDRVFYFILRGEKTEQKRIILGKCLLLCTIKWRNTKTKDKGKPLQPGTMAQLLKVLFGIFRQKHIKFNHHKDFNGDGEFHAVLKSQWEQQKAKDPTFATGVNTSTFDYEADYKIREAYRDNKFDPFSMSDEGCAYDDRCRYLVFILGRYFLLRGRKELAFLKWKQIHFCEAHEEGKAVKYIELRHEWDKSHQLKLTNTTARDPKDTHARIYPDDTDDLCPYKYLTFYKTLCMPTQERVFCQKNTDKQWKAKLAINMPHLYNEKKPMGENSIDGITKEFAKEMGFENWERCTNHGNRKLGLTTAMTNTETVIAPIVLGTGRHKNFNTSLTYVKSNPRMRHKYDNAIHGKHSKSPPASPKHKKMARFDEDYKPPAVIIASKEKQEDGKKGFQESVPMLNDSDSISTNTNYAAALTTYQSAENLPLVTPANMLPTKTIVNQHHLSNIQRNIFLQLNNTYAYWSQKMQPPCEQTQYNIPHDANLPTSDFSYLQSEMQKKKIEDEKKKELVQQIEALKQQLVVAKEKHEEVLSSYKEKYDDIKQDLREARQNAKLLDLQVTNNNTKQQCTIL